MSADGILTVSVVGWDIDPKFLARVQITSLPAAQPVGMGRWRIAIGPTVTRVEITLTVRNADLSKPLESLEQVFGVETSNNIRTLRPVLCYNHGDGWSPGSPPVATDPIWHRRLHPRLHWSADSAHEFPGLVIDFAFVVVTAYLKGISSLEYVYNHAADPNEFVAARSVIFAAGRGPLMSYAVRTVLYHPLRAVVIKRFPFLSVHKIQGQQQFHALKKLRV